MMTPRDRFRKALLFLAIVVYYVGGYLLVNHWSFQRGVFHDLTLPGEEKLPFIPFFLVGYISMYGVIIYLYLHLQDLSFFKGAARAFFICVTFHLALFLLFPVRYNLRPSFDPEASWLLTVVDFYYWLDLPYNCFPSLHVSNAFLGLFLLRRYDGKGRVIHPRLPILALALFISASVVLVKQHYILDVVAAVPVAFFANWLAFRKKFDTS